MRWINSHKATVVLIVVAVIAVAGTWLARSSRADDAPSGEALPASTVSSPTSGASPGTSEPATLDAASETGPTSTVASTDRLEIPVDPSGSRQRRDEAGARQATIDYVSTVKQRVLYLGDDGARTVLESWAASGVTEAEVDDTLERLSLLRDSLSASGGEVWWVVSPLAVKVEAFEADQARVSVWTATVLASGAPVGVDATVAAPQVAYHTSTVELVWSETAGWSVWSIVDVAGPVPLTATGQTPSSPNEFLTALSGFSLIKEHR